MRMCERCGAKPTDGHDIEPRMLLGLCSASLCGKCLRIFERWALTHETRIDLLFCDRMYGQRAGDDIRSDPGFDKCENKASAELDMHNMIVKWLGAE